MKKEEYTPATRQVLAQLNIEHNSGNYGNGQTKVTTLDGHLVYCNEIALNHVAGNRPKVTIVVRPEVMNWLIENVEVTVIEDGGAYIKERVVRDAEFKSLEKLKAEILEIAKSEFGSRILSLLGEEYDL